MAVKARGWCLVVLAALTSVGALAAQPGLLLDPWRTPDLVARLLDDPTPLTVFGTVHVLVFASGQTAGPTTCEPFSQLPYPGGEVATRLVKACRAAGVHCCWVADLLRWERPNLPSAGLRGKVPDWLEQNLSGEFGVRPETACYASPWDSRVVSALNGLMTTMAGWAPQPDGLVLACRLSPNDVLGFGPQARRAMVLAHGLDPLDIVGPPATTTWHRLREQTMSDLLTQLVATWHAQCPDVPCHGLTTALRVDQSPGLALYTADNGVKWAGDRLIDSVLVDGPWWEDPLRDSVWRDWGRASKYFAKGDRQREFDDRLHAVVWTRDGNGQLRLVEQMEALRRQGCRTDQMVFYPTADKDLSVIAASIADAQP